MLRLHQTRARMGGPDGDASEALAEELRLPQMSPAHEPGSIGRVYYVYGKSAQQVYGKSAQSGVEKYARVPNWKSESTSVSGEPARRGASTISAPKFSVRSSAPESKRSSAAPAARRGWPA